MPLAAYVTPSNRVGVGKTMASGAERYVRTSLVHRTGERLADARLGKAPVEKLGEGLDVDTHCHGAYSNLLGSSLRLESSSFLPDSDFAGT